MHSCHWHRNVCAGLVWWISGRTRHPPLPVSTASRSVPSSQYKMQGVQLDGVVWVGGNKQLCKSQGCISLHILVGFFYRLCSTGRLPQNLWCQLVEHAKEKNKKKIKHWRNKQKHPQTSFHIHRMCSQHVKKTVQRKTGQEVITLFIPFCDSS